MLTKDRNTPHREGVFTSEPLTAGAQVYAGGLVVSDSATGFSKAGATGTGLVARGVAQETVVGSAVDGDVRVTVRRGWHSFDNSAGADEITRMHLGQTAYIVDDETVALTDGTATRSAAGEIVDVDSDGVWIDI
jgi:hypothetical protein